MVDKRAEACLACHTPGKVLARPQRTDRMRIFSAPSGGRVLAVIQPIANEPACSQAPCHYHPANQQVLGTIDLQMSLATIDAIFRTGIRRSLAGVLLLVLSVAAIAILFTLFLVDRPVRRLIEGTHQVAEGDLDHVIPIRSQDELGLLARSFNEMTRRLKEAMQVIRHYNETLEEKVEQKTQELKRAQERMLHVERMATVGRLAAIIAHEINNPLSGIRTYAKLLQKRLMRKSDMNEETGRYLDLIESESARCGNIVRDLLQFSRKSPMEFKPADISKLAREAVRLVQHRLDLQAIDVRMSLPEDLPEFRCSDQQVIQALLAIMINACEAMPSDGTLKISTGGESSGVWVLVEDSGTGMDDETKRHIYEPFFTTKEEGHGVGLGLAVVFTIVSRHGGHIDVDSTPGKGTRFTLHFPLQPPVPEEGQGAEEAS
ncbi:MAG: ATP-binding protein [Acidobacteriota bacterium]